LPLLPLLGNGKSAKLKPTSEENQRHFSRALEADEGVFFRENRSGGIDSTLSVKIGEESAMPPDLPVTSNFQDEDGAGGWIV